MYILIFTVFIAELIIAVAIISSVVKFDKKVLAANSQVTEVKDLTASALTQIKQAVGTSKSTVREAIDFVERKRREYSRKILQNIILYISMIFCKGKYKQAAIIFQLIVAIRDYIRESKV